MFLTVMFVVYVVFCFLAFGCQYQCNQLSGKTCLRSNVLYVEWDVKPTHSLTRHRTNVIVADDIRAQMYVHQSEKTSIALKSVFNLNIL